MNKFINLMFTIFWIIGIYIFATLIYKSTLTNDNALYISAIAILISSFLASLSMIKSIHNSKLIEKSKIEKEKEVLILHFEYLLLSSLDKINTFNTRFQSDLKRMKSPNCGNDEVQKVYNNYFISNIIESSTQLNNIKKELENPDLYKYIEDGNRLLLVHICMELANFEQILNALKTTQEHLSLTLIDKVNPDINMITKKIISLIKIQKENLEENHPSESLCTIDEYEEQINK